MTSDDDKSGGKGDESLDGLARQYLDLWQDQLTALSANPVMSEAMASFFAKWTPPAADGASPPTREQQDGAGPDNAQPTDGAAAGRAASVAGDDRLGELLDRLERIEERLARLEQS